MVPGTPMMTSDLARTLLGKRNRPPSLHMMMTPTMDSVPGRSSRFAPMLFFHPAKDPIITTFTGVAGTCKLTMIWVLLQVLTLHVLVMTIYSLGHVERG